MRKIVLSLSALILSILLNVGSLNAQSIPELLWYHFNESGTSVTNYASTPPVGTATGTLVGAMTQGGSGICGGALIGTGGLGTADNLSTGWVTNFPTSGWTISFWTGDIPPSATLFYIMGDASAGNLRCFTNGVAGADNWLLRGPVTDVIATGGAVVGPTLTTFVYDSLLGNIKAYVNGSLVSTVAQIAPLIISGTGPMIVGSNGGSTGLPAGGWMDDFRIYDHPLSATEVLDLMDLSSSDAIHVTSYFDYTSPSGNYVWNTSGTYMDTLTNSLGCDSILTIYLTIRTNTNPSVLHYKFDGTGTDVINYAEYPPVGTDTAHIMGTASQGSNGQCVGAYIGDGGASSVNYLSTGWQTDLTNTSWTIAFWSSNIDQLDAFTAGYIFGDGGALSFRCFTGGLADSGNWIVRGGGLTDVWVPGGAQALPTHTAIVYDQSLNEVRAYVDGALVTTTPQGTPNILSSGEFKMGGYGSSDGLYPNNYIDEFRVYDRALSPAEIADLLDMTTTSSQTLSTCYSYVSPSGNYTWTTSGTYYDTISNLAGCDSIMQFNLTVNYSGFNTIDLVRFFSYTSPSGNYVWTTSGTYQDTIPTIHGCDSILTINLTINNYTEPGLLHYRFNGSGAEVMNYAIDPPSGTDTAIIYGAHVQGGNGLCGGALISGGDYSDVNYMSTGWVTDLTNTAWTIAFWSDSVSYPGGSAHYLFGDIDANSFRCFAGGAADSANWLLRGAGLSDVLIIGGAQMVPTFTAIVYDDTANEVRAYVNGVLVNTVPQGTLSISGGGDFKLGGYSASLCFPVTSKIDEFRLYNRMLDSLEIVGLMNPVSVTNISETACDSYVSPSGLHTWTSSGIYNDTLQNIGGCDSLVIIDLTVNNSSTATISPSACASYTSPSGNFTWTTSGTYHDTIANVAGCDSLLTIVLSVTIVETGVTQSGFTLTADAVSAGYQWLDCDNSYAVIPGETGQSYTPSLDGNYAVEVTQSTCVDTSSCFTISGIGMEESNKLPAVSIQPNPSTGLFTLTMDVMADRIDVCEITGKLISSFVPDSEKLEMNLEDLSNGVYIIRVNFGDGTKLLRLVINK